MSWILTANRTGARILDAQGGTLTLLETIDNEQGRLRNRDIDSDRHGRTFDRAASGRHAFSTEEAPTERIAKAFARGLADKLRQARLTGQFERLVLVAEPHFLGLMREALDVATERAVIASVAKDLAEVPVDRLAAHLPELPRAAV